MATGTPGLAAGSYRAGIACLIGGLALVTVSDTVVRWVAPHLPLHEIMLIRGCATIPAITIGALLIGGRSALRAGRLSVQILRGALLAATNMVFFLGLASLPYAEAIALFHVAPLIITAMSAVLLGERVGLWRLVAVVAGLTGVVIMFRPFGEGIGFAAALPVGAAALYAGVQVLNRYTRHTDSGAMMALSAHSGILVLSIVAGLTTSDGRFADPSNSTSMFLFGEWLVPRWEHVWLIVFGGLVNSVAAFLLFQSYRLAEAPLLSPFEYFALPLAACSGFFLWNEVPDATALVGIVLIVGAGLTVAWRESRYRERSTVAKSANGPSTTNG